MLKHLLYLIAIAMTVCGQTPPLVTDRPGFTDSAEVVPAGALQLEGGIGMETEHAAGQREYFWGTPVLRIGLGHGMEALLDSDGAISEGGRPSSDVGIGDVGVGLKYRLWKETKRRPVVGLTANFELPTGSSQFRESGVSPTVKLAWSKEDIGRGFDVSGNVDWSSLGTETGRVRQIAVTASLDRELRGFGVFVEAFGIGEQHAAGVAYWVATGLTHGIGANAQWDVSVTRRLNQQGPDWAISGGLVFRHLPARHH